MGGCFTKEDDEINPSLSGLNDSRHVMMRKSSIKKNEPPLQLDGSAYKPRQEHKLPKELELDFNMEKDDACDGLTAKSNSNNDQGKESENRKNGK